MKKEKLWAMKMKFNKQIGEIASIICDGKQDGKTSVDIAQALYFVGYRRQIHAEWKSGKKNGQCGWYCTNCGAGFTGDNAEWIAKEHYYCPKCGAKMD